MDAMKKIFLLTAISCLFSLHAFAAKKPIAEVIKIRGSATKLLPGALEASKIELGDQLVEDTSVLTAAKSFIKIRFIDKSEVSLGPESKIVISQMASSAPGIISLLKGRIRAEVQKEQEKESNDNKFYVRTRTAALGIRGTDFQTIYNPDNRMTSLLTFKGAVAMARVDETTHQKLESQSGTQQKVVERIDMKDTPEVKTIPGKAINEQEELQKILANNQTVVVPPGQNAFSSQSLKNASLPVKINPVQLNALYKNRDFEEKNIVNLKSGIGVDDSKLTVTQAPQKAPAEGLYDPKSGAFAPKAGGFIDLNTGLYVAPGPDAVLDTEKGIYKSKAAGDIDADTGDYFAPKGLILDAKKGFIVDQNAGDKPELLALKDDLNKAIARDVVVGELDAENKIAFNIKEKFIRNRLAITIGMGDEEQTVNEDSNHQFNFKLQAPDSLRVKLDWDMASTGRWTTFFGMSYQNAEYENLAAQNMTQDSPALFGLSGGLMYALNREIDLRTQLKLHQSHFASQNSSNSFILKRIVSTRASFGARGVFFEKGRFSFLTEADLNIIFRKRFNDIVIEPGAGFNLKLMPRWSINERGRIGIGLSLMKEKEKVKSSIASHHIRKSYSGLEALYSLDF